MVAVVLPANIVKVKCSIVPITEFTIIDFIDCNFRSSFRMKIFAVNMTRITLN